MHSTENNENIPVAMVATSQYGGPRTKPVDRSPSHSPSPVPIRKSRPFQSLTPNQIQISRRVLGDDKENQRPISIPQRPSGLRLDQSTVILQPPAHFNILSETAQSQPAHQHLISKPATHPVQLGLVPLSNQWTPNQNCAHSGRLVNVDEIQCNPNIFTSYARRDAGAPQVDPFAQLSARTLELMDQPESEVTIYDCEYCDKTYQGKHARSIWRRHLSDKHKIPLSTQPRRTRWDNDANRPKTEEERRERTLESKRRWARKNRAAKKAARDGQRSSIDQSVVTNHSESMVSDPYRASQDRSRAPSPSSFSVSLGHGGTGALQYRPGTGHHARSQSIQGENRSQVSSMTRGSSVPHAFSPYPSMAPRASLPFGNASYNPSFSFSAVASTPEWSFPIPCSHNASLYSFESMTSNGHGQSPGQFSDRFTNEGLQQNHSPRNFPNLVRRHSLTAYATEGNHQQIDERRELSEEYSSASLTSQYGHWELDGRFSTPGAVPVNITQLDTSSYETQLKRPRLSQSSTDDREFQPIGIQDMTKSTISPSDTLQVSFKNSPEASMHDEEVDSELGAIAEEHISSADGQEDFHHSPMRLSIPVEEGRVRPTTSGTLSSLSRPATSGTISSMSHESEMDRNVHLNRAATEPHFAVRYDLQTPNHTRADSSNASLYPGSFAPMSTGKRVVSDNMQIPPFCASAPMSINDWNNHVLGPSGLSRFPFSNALSSPSGGLFGSPNRDLGKSLGLSLNTSVSGEDCLGGFLGGTTSAWDMIHQRTS